MLGDWIIVFRFNTQRRRVQTPIESQYDFNELKDGFWIDENHKLVRESRGKYWIPPGQVDHIEKLS